MLFTRIKDYIRSKLPTKLFTRFVLMVLLPMFLMQSISMYIFFHRYWNKTSLQNIEIFSKEVYMLNNMFNRHVNAGEDSDLTAEDLNIFTNIRINFIKDTKIEKPTITYNKIKHFLNPIKHLENELYLLNIGKIALYKISDSYYNIEIEKENGVLLFIFNKNRIFIQRIDLIIFWNILNFIIMGTIALLYIKNQVKSIIRLGVFANEFSYLEKENSNFKPSGAKEIRESGIAVLNMVRKMKNLLNTRTTMLAQISHDLRTPLTRMKLQTEFLEDETIADFFKKDLDEMEKLIDEYLLFAKGENENDFKKVNIKIFFDDILADYERSGYKNITINYSIRVENIFLKQDSFKRCINNLINNALKYARGKIELFVKTTNNSLLITVDDDGNGIAKDMFEKMQLIFYKCSSAKTNGVGLGLFIVKNIVNMHRGKIYFGKSKLGGLQVKIKIPIINNKRVKNEKN